MVSAVGTPVAPKALLITKINSSQNTYQKSYIFVGLRPQKHATVGALGTPKIYENPPRGPFGALLGQKALRFFFKAIFWGTLFDPWASKVPSKTPPKKHLNFNASKIMKK